MLELCVVLYIVRFMPIVFHIPEFTIRILNDFHLHSESMSSRVSCHPSHGAQLCVTQKRTTQDTVPARGKFHQTSNHHAPALSSAALLLLVLYKRYTLVLYNTLTERVYDSYESPRIYDTGRREAIHTQWALSPSLSFLRSSSFSAHKAVTCDSRSALCRCSSESCLCNATGIT